MRRCSTSPPGTARRAGGCPTRRFSTSCNTPSASPTRNSTTTCRSSARPGDTPASGVAPKLEAYLLDWVALLLRWAHVIVGIAWIGASFYFIWLDNRLEPARDPALAGELSAIHGGGFYRVQKYRLAPDELPARLHWF